MEREGVRKPVSLAGHLGFGWELIGPKCLQTISSPSELVGLALASLWH